jgi:hypothetical protein
VAGVFHMQQRLILLSKAKVHFRDNHNHIEQRLTRLPETHIPGEQDFQVKVSQYKTWDDLETKFHLY